jgi:hypothetical protein
MTSILTILRTAIAILVLTAIGHQLVVHIAGKFNVINFFSYFTNLSNLFAALVLLLSVFSTSLRNKSYINFLRYVSVVNMTIVGLVFATMLRNVEFGALLPWVNFVLHYVMPVALVLDWLANPPAQKLGMKSLFLAMIFPATYLAYTILRGAAIAWYPYPFLNPANVGGYGGVAMYSMGITITFLLVSWLLLVVGNRLANK